MSIHYRSEYTFMRHATTPRRKMCAAEIVALILLAIVLLGAGEARSQQPVAPPLTQAQIDNEAMLDKLLAAHDYKALHDKMLASPDPSLVVPTLNWAKARMIGGASVFVPLLYAQLLWAVASSSQQYAFLKTTAGLIIGYSLLVTYADGVKCADQTAPQHHRDVILSQYGGEFQSVAQLPDQDKDRVFHTNIEMEQGIAPRRQNDNYLCRFGMQEIRDSLEKHPAKETPGTPGSATHVGKVMDVQVDLDYQPTFLSREEWEPKQTAQRAQFATLLPAIFDRYKNVPAPLPPTPQAPSPPAEP
jgi:hypothetical protein